MTTCFRRLGRLRFPPNTRSVSKVPWKPQRLSEVEEVPAAGESNQPLHTQRVNQQAFSQDSINKFYASTHLRKNTPALVVASVIVISFLFLLLSKLVEPNA